MRLTPVMLSALVALLGGCARYEYSIVQPPDRVGPITSAEDRVVQLDPISYRLRTVDNRLVVRIFNPGPTPVEIVGSQSSVVDPTGQSRPVRSVLIPVNAFAQVVLPPIRPQYRDTSGSDRPFGFANRREFGLTDNLPPDPPREYTYDDGGEIYWDWPAPAQSGGAEGQARLTLAFRIAGPTPRTWRDEFTFTRRRL